MNVLQRLKTRALYENDDEGRLVVAAASGDRRAFDTLIRRYERLLLGFLARRVGPAAEDVFQEACLAGWVALPMYRGQARFKAWIFGIAQHKCADHYRRQAHHPAETALEEAHEIVDPEDRYAHADLRRAVSRLLAQLPTEQREVLELYYYADLTLAETAQALNRNLNTVKAQFYRAHSQAAGMIDSPDADAPQSYRNGVTRSR